MDKRALAEQLAFWLAQQRIHDRARTAARKDAGRWMKRMQLARQANEPELMTSAMEQAEKARDQYQLAERRYQEATAEAAALRNTPPTDNTAFAAAIERSRHAMQEFEKLGIVELGTSAQMAVDAEFLLNKAPADSALAPNVTPTPTSINPPPNTPEYDDLEDDILAMADAILAQDEARAGAANDDGDNT